MAADTNILEKPVNKSPDHYDNAENDLEQLMNSINASSNVERMRIAADLFRKAARESLSSR